MFSSTRIPGSAMSDQEENSQKLESIIPDIRYRILLEDTMGGPKSCQEEAARRFAYYLSELDAYFQIEVVKTLVKMATASDSWWFLVSLFALSDTKTVGLQIVWSMMKMPDESKMHDFMCEILDYISSRESFDLSPASDVLKCIMLAHTDTVDDKKNCVDELVIETERNAFKLNKLPEEDVHRLFDGAKPAFLDMCSTEQNALLGALLADTTSHCQHFALVLALFSSEWDLAESIQKSGAVNGVVLSVLFKSEVTSKTFKTAAIVLQNCLSIDTDSHTLSLTFIEPPSIEIDTEACIDYLLTHDDHTLLPLFMEECRNSHLFGAGAIAALWTADLELAKTMTLSEIDIGRDITVILSEMMDIAHWCLVLDIFNLRPGILEPKVVNKILIGASERLYDPKASAVLKKLLGFCTDVSVLKSVLELVLHFTIASDLFCIFVTKDLIDLSAVHLGLSGSLLSAVVFYLADHRYSWKQNPAFSSAARPYSVILSKCIETGLSTHPSQFTHAYSSLGKLPLQAALEHADLGLVQLLVKVGATCNLELYTLTRDADLRMRLQQENQELLDYLDTAASNPRSLQELCVQTVSHHIGCRADRKHRALSLGLPLHMVHKVLFYDVLFSDPVLMNSHT